MKASIRHRLGAVAGIITLAIGVGFVAVIQMFMSLFQEPASAYTTRVFDQPLVVRPADNMEPAAPQKLELSCYDPHILPIWQELKKDELFRKWLEYSTGALNCSEMLEVRRIDLNRDGNEEVLVQGKGLELCTPTGNCGFWIFELKKSKVRRMLAGYDFYPGLYEPKFGEQVQKSTTGGYSDILLAGHSKSDQTSYRTYRYDGSRYVESRCVYEIPKTNRQGNGSWELVPCLELDVKE